MRKAVAPLALLAATALGIGLAVGTFSTPAWAADPVDLHAATQRPLSDFLSAQGSTSTFIPPLPDFIGWSNNNPQTLFASVDNLGLVSSYLASHGGPVLGTQVSGSVRERPLADGRAEVTVIIHSTNALTWVTPLPSDNLATSPLLFGYRGTDLLTNPALTPALSSAEMKVVFKNTAPGAALPDLVVAFILGNAEPGQELVMLGFKSSGFGPLHALAGVPEGTPGRCNVVQTGLLMTRFMGATADGFPAERVDLGAAGRTAMGALSSGGQAGQPKPVQSGTWGRLKNLYR